jgi:hypothetical protein
VVDFLIETVDTDTGATVYLPATTDSAPLTAHEVDPAAWQLADCEHCDGHIQRRSPATTDQGVTDGRWRHTRNGLQRCHSSNTDDAMVGPNATPLRNPGSEA